MGEGMTRPECHAVEQRDLGWLLKPGTGRNDRGTFRPVPPTKIRNCVRMEFNSNHQELTSLHLEVSIVDEHADLIMLERS